VILFTLNNKQIVNKQINKVEMYGMNRWEKIRYIHKIFHLYDELFNKWYHIFATPPTCNYDDDTFAVDITNPSTQKKNLLKQVFFLNVDKLYITLQLFLLNFFFFFFSKGSSDLGYCKLPLFKKGDIIFTMT
jgi:hypothetical protein